MERDLITRASAGDLDAFTELIRLRQAAIRAFCARLLADRDTADDVAQDVFLAAFVSLESFDPSRDFDTWLRGIARNKVRMALRREGVRREALDRILCREAERRLPDESGATERVLEALKGCLASLGGKAREVLSLFYLEQLPANEAAPLLGMSEPAFYTALTRTRQALRKCVGQARGETWE